MKGIKHMPFLLYPVQIPVHFSGSFPWDLLGRTAANEQQNQELGATPQVYLRATRCGSRSSSLHPLRTACSRTSARTRRALTALAGVNPHLLRLNRKADAELLVAPQLLHFLPANSPEMPARICWPRKNSCRFRQCWGRWLKKHVTACPSAFFLNCSHKSQAIVDLEVIHTQILEVILCLD